MKTYYDLTEKEINSYKNKFAKLDYAKKNKKDESVTLLCLSGTTVLLFTVLVIGYTFKNSLLINGLESIFTFLLALFLIIFLYVRISYEIALQKWLKVKHKVQS